MRISDTKRFVARSCNREALSTTRMKSRKGACNGHRMRRCTELKGIGESDTTSIKTVRQLLDCRRQFLRIHVHIYDIEEVGEIDRSCHT